ncbi:hypothetical protein FBU59_000688 [Linderina macrospora]|uniref:Uncharacterized protein n=1 Tax=Linderina macrospora TaxID=4868 RepID=A0ACC1JG48_9FUNG|nr:hypothetical protein FBU59_000688 [Linderina macrospora]
MFCSCDAHCLYSIPDSDDEVERMLATLAWWFLKLLTHTGKVLKPFNSVLGEQFFCYWEIDANELPSPAGISSSSATAVSTESDEQDAKGKPCVEYITEQISHHLPVSVHVY